MQGQLLGTPKRRRENSIITDCIQSLKASSGLLWLKTVSAGGLFRTQ